MVSRRPRRPVISIIASTWLALGALTVEAAARLAERPGLAAPALAVRYRDVISPARVRALTVLPGTTVEFDVADSTWRTAVASRDRRRAGSIRWVAGAGRGRRPSRRGLYPSTWWRGRARLGNAERS
jgi:hypothetical protein